MLSHGNKDSEFISGHVQVEILPKEQHIGYLRGSIVISKRQKIKKELPRQKKKKLEALENQKQLKVNALVSLSERLETTFDNLSKLTAKEAGPIAIMLSFRAIGPTIDVSSTTKKVDCAWCFNPIEAKYPVYTVKIPRGIKLPFSRMTSWNQVSRTLKIHPECIESIINQMETISDTGQPI